MPFNVVCWLRRATPRLLHRPMQSPGPRRGTTFLRVQRRRQTFVRGCVELLLNDLSPAVRDNHGSSGGTERVEPLSFPKPRTLLFLPAFMTTRDSWSHFSKSGSKWLLALPLPSAASWPPCYRKSAVKIHNPPDTNRQFS